MLIGSGLQVLTTLGKFKPAVLGEIQAGGDIYSPWKVSALPVSLASRAKPLRRRPVRGRAR
jgi:hypothetical protein